MLDKFVSNVYALDPSGVKFDDKYIKKNRGHTDAQYTSTKLLIKEQGQTKPVYLLNGLCVDGRHRTKIAVELGRQVLCRDVNPKLSKEAITILCNEEILSGRDYDLSQRAIWAHRELVLGLGFSIAKAAKMSKVDRRMISYASTIKGLDRGDILDALMSGQKIQLEAMVRPSTSLEVICKHIKAEVEDKTISVDDSERVHFNPDALIKTEAGKAWFYEKVNRVTAIQDNYEVTADYLELANLKFKLGVVDNA